MRMMMMMIQTRLMSNDGVRRRSKITNLFNFER